MACGAERLKVRRIEEHRAVPPMRLDVIDVARLDMLALRRMHPAPGLTLQMLGAEPPPLRREVERPPRLFGPAFSIMASVASASRC